MIYNAGGLHSHSENYLPCQIEAALTVNVQLVGYAELCLQSRVAHHTGERLPLGVALWLPHVAHLHSGGAVRLVLTLPLGPPVQLCLPENLSGGAAALSYAGSHQWLVPIVQQGCWACGHVHLWLHCLECEKMGGRRKKWQNGERLWNKYYWSFCVYVWINNVQQPQCTYQPKEHKLISFLSPTVNTLKINDTLYPSYNWGFKRKCLHCRVPRRKWVQDWVINSSITCCFYYYYFSKVHHLRKPLSLVESDAVDFVQCLSLT